MASISKRKKKKIKRRSQKRKCIKAPVGELLKMWCPANYGLIYIQAKGFAAVLPNVQYEKLLSVRVVLRGESSTQPV